MASNDPIALPLAGVSVVDFTRVLAGPHCTKTLSDLGADVIKIEPPRPDVARFAAPSTGFMSGYYAQQNAGKRTISIDLWKHEARDIVHRLCDDADIVVENFRPGTLDSFGLGYEGVASTNPGIIYASISGYGRRGDWQSRMAYAPTVEAEAGLTELTHRHHRPGASDAVSADPAEWRSDSLSHADVTSGLQATIAILAALHERTRSGLGQHIDIAMAAAVVRLNERVHVDARSDGESDESADDEPSAFAAAESPFFRSPSGRVMASSTSLIWSVSFSFWLAAMRRPDLAHDPRFASPTTRAANIDALHAIVQTWMSTFADDASLDAQLDESKIAIGAVRTVSELRETEWAKDWGAFHDVEDRAGGTYPVPGHPWHFSRSGLAGPGLAAFQGEHNRDVLTALGYSDADVERLHSDRVVIARRPAERAN